MDNEVVNSGVFHIAMTKGSSRHIRIDLGQVMGMFKSCDKDKICTIHRIATFHQTTEDPKPELIEKSVLCPY